MDSFYFYKGQLFGDVNVKNMFTSHIDEKKNFDIFLDFFIFIHFHYMKMHLKNRLLDQG
jgi:hypothetical protein